MGLFKVLKSLTTLTKQAGQLQREQQVQAGYGPGLGGMVDHLGGLVEVAGDQMSQVMASQADQQRLLDEGIPAEAVIVAMGTPARGAQRYNLSLDLEVHLSGRPPYRIASNYIVPATVPLGPGVRLPVRVDPADQARLAIDWDNVEPGPVHGVVRPVDERADPTAAAPSVPAAGPSADPDPIAQLERLARLRDAGALTDAEFEQQKALILGG